MRIFLDLSVFVDKICQLPNEALKHTRSSILPNLLLFFIDNKTRNEILYLLVETNYLRVVKCIEVNNLSSTGDNKVKDIINRQLQDRFKV